MTTMQKLEAESRAWNTLEWAVHALVTLLSPTEPWGLYDNIDEIVSALLNDLADEAEKARA